MAGGVSKGGVRGARDATALTILKRKIDHVLRDVSYTRAIIKKQEKEAKVEKQAGNTYTDVLRRGGLGPRSTPRTIPVPLRHLREVLITPGTETSTQKYRNRAELVEELYKAGHKDVVVARRLPSGDIYVIIETVKDKEVTIKKGDIIRVFSKSARIKKRTYIILAYRIKVLDINSSRQVEAIISIKT